VSLRTTARIQTYISWREYMNTRINLVLTSLSLFFTSIVSMANSDVEELTKNTANWAMPLGNYAGTRYSDLDQINHKNVKNLQVAWSFSTGVFRGHEGGPLVVDDIIYIHTPFPNSVFALDQKTQSAIWKYEPRMSYDDIVPIMCCDTVNRGLAYGDGKIFLQQADTVLTALDAKTGKIVWQVKNGDPELGMTNTQAPLVVKGKVITGISGGEYGVRGFLAAYDIKTGTLQWKGYSMGPDEEMLIDSDKTTTWDNGKVTPVGKNSSLKTWQEDQWTIGGGTTWGWYTYDADLNLIYYGTGNPSTWNPVQRPGDNKWANSIWARDADTGQVKWVYQTTPHDQWGYDGTNEMVLVDQKINGEMRQALVHFDHNGFAYALDRVTGELLQANKFDTSVNWASHIDMTTGRPQVVAKYSPEHHGEDVETYDICPSNMGAKNQQPVSFSPKTDLFYISATHICMGYEPFEVEYVPGQFYVGAAHYNIKVEGDSHMGEFKAFDVTTGKIKWSIKEPFPVWSGSLATAGNVVFYGTVEGHLKAVDAKTGRELYKLKTPSGIIGNINTWTYNGKQYIGVLSGIGGWVGIELATPSLGDDYLEPNYSETSGWYPSLFRTLGAFTQLGGVFTVFALPDD